MKNVIFLFLVAGCSFLLLLGMVSCSESEEAGEVATEAEPSETNDATPSGFGEEFSFAGTWVSESEGEEVRLVLHEDGPGTLHFEGVEEPFRFSWNVESSSSETRRNVRLHFGGAPLTLSFRYDGPDSLRLPSFLVVENGKPTRSDGWTTWTRE